MPPVRNLFGGVVPGMRTTEYSGYGNGSRRRTPQEIAEEQAAADRALRQRQLDQQAQLHRETMQSQERQTSESRRMADQSQRRQLFGQSQMTEGPLQGNVSEARKVFGLDDAAGGGPAARPPVDMQEVRRKRLFDEAQFARSKQRFAESHPGEMKRMFVQAAPGAAPLEERGAGAGQGAAEIGQYAGQQRADYEKSVPFIRGLAEMKNARNAKLAEIAAKASAGQASVGALAANPQAQSDMLNAPDWQNAPAGVNKPYTPNMGRQPEALTPDESRAMNESPANTLAKAKLTAPDPTGEVAATRAIDEQLSRIRANPPGSVESKKAMVIYKALMAAQGKVADMTTGQGQAQTPAAPKEAPAENPPAQQAAPVPATPDQVARVEAASAASNAAGAGQTITPQPAPNTQQAHQQYMDELNSEIDYWQKSFERAGGAAPGAAAQTPQNQWELDRSLRRRVDEAKLGGFQEDLAGKKQTREQQAGEYKYTTGARPEAEAVKTASVKGLASKSAMDDATLAKAKTDQVLAEKALQREPENYELQKRAGEAKIDAAKAEIEASKSKTALNNMLVNERKEQGPEVSPNKAAANSGALEAIETPWSSRPWFGNKEFFRPTLGEGGEEYTGRILAFANQVGSVIANQKSTTERQRLAASEASLPRYKAAKETLDILKNRPAAMEWASGTWPAGKPDPAQRVRLVKSLAAYVTSVENGLEVATK